MGWGWARDEASNAGDNVIEGNWVNGAAAAAGSRARCFWLMCGVSRHSLSRQQLAA